MKRRETSLVIVYTGRFSDVRFIKRNINMVPTVAPSVIPVSSIVFDELIK